VFISNPAQASGPGHVWAFGRGQAHGFGVLPDPGRGAHFQTRHPPPEGFSAGFGPKLRALVQRQGPPRADLASAAAPFARLNCPAKRQYCIT